MHRNSVHVPKFVRQHCLGESARVKAASPQIQLNSFLLKAIQAQLFVITLCIYLRSAPQV